MKQFLKIKLVFGLLWKINPSYVFLLLFNSLVFTGRILGNVVLPKYLIDELTGEKDLSRLLLWVGMIVSANLLFYFLGKVSQRLLDVRREVLEYEIQKAFADKIMNIEYRHLENPYYLDLKERAQFAMRNQSAATNLVNNLTDAVKQLFTLAGLLAVMLRLSWILVALLAVTIALMLLVQASFANYQQKFFREIIPVNRRYGYYVGLSFQDIYQKDFRLYDMSGMLGDRITLYNREIADWFTAYHRREGLFMGLYQWIQVLQTALAYGYVGLRCVAGFQGASALSIGSLTLYVQAAIQFSTSIMAFGGNLIAVNQMLGYLDTFLELMVIPDEKDLGGKEKLGEIGSIRFDDVTFTYPGSEKPVLEHISFTIEKGQKISIVGLNGAGKSTLVKLLCRLYRPDSGTISVNGIDIFSYDHASYLREIAAVFQDFKLFNFTIEENITSRPEGADEEKVAEILDEVGLADKIRELPHGVRTLFGKLYDAEGVEMSGGQAQKVAIARALYKGGSLVILDEPTSALDPIAEAEIYENFNQMVGGKTALYISHRMSSSVFCDKILVLNHGQVEDFDTHAALMRRPDSTYARLFRSQAVNYAL